MKKYIALSLLLAAASVSAQNTYTNAVVTSTSDLSGTARYVGMGGALGALGADISAISSNPAAIGMYRKNDISLTAGVLWPKNRSYDEGDALTHGTFDQMGFVTAFHVGGEDIEYVNFSFNYQKKHNFNNAFYADNPNTFGLSQLDQLAYIKKRFDSNKNLLATAYNAYLINQDDYGYYNPWSANSNQYASYSTGSSQNYDVNLSFNAKDQYYFGLTIGCENIDYDKWTTYTEFRNGDILAPIQDYTLYNDQRVNGVGVNFKLGTIIRPIEESPFRFGLTVESPTWYNMKSSVVHSIDSRYDTHGEYLSNYYNHKSYDNSYLEYNLRTPWRFRASLGTTISRYLALGAEYEYADYGFEHMSYGSNNWDERKTQDKEMNKLTKRTLQGQHTVRLGAEVKPTDNWAFRVGYNYISSIYKKNAFLDSCIDSYAMDYMTSTSYMNLGATNLMTLGVGYKYKFFYADLTYKIRNQSGDFYAFDDSFMNDGDFVANNPALQELSNYRLTPTNVDLTRHEICMTLGFKF